MLFFFGFWIGEFLLDCLVSTWCVSVLLLT
jgi:hypothetical protein